ncbi:MAG: hypothetical protein EA384_02810 [Spirochaetaceae bacterium]|nr:MAG: hypothetical protein EA384_02810 [Spirochaetaceae bacterium]
MNNAVQNLDRARSLSMMFAADQLEFSRPNGWELLADHVEKHRYWIGRELDVRVTWNDAVFSWYENVVVPLKRAVGSWEFRSAFPRQAAGNLYLAVSDHWHYLKEHNPAVSAEDAARSFAVHYGCGIGRWFSRFLL